ncbi:MAG: DUF3872 domain-containing protein [Bacteroides sp.]|nr:DUF3872 domain-containing protein [Bacteroides sp.]
MKNRVNYKFSVNYYLWIVLFTAVFSLIFIGCKDKLEIQYVYGFELKTMPVPKKIKLGETIEIRCELIREGKYDKAKYYIRYFQPDGSGELMMDDGTLFQPNDLYPLSKESFRLYYTSRSAESHVIDVYVQDNFGNVVQSSFSFSHDSD